MRQNTPRLSTRAHLAIILYKLNLTSGRGRGEKRMQEIRKHEGLTPEELEGHTVELLPNRE